MMFRENHHMKTGIQNTQIMHYYGDWGFRGLGLLARVVGEK